MHQFDEWLDSGLTLPIDGVEYRVEPPSARTVLALHRALAEGNWSDLIERRQIRALLGDTWAAMTDSGVPELAALHAGRAVIAYYADSADSMRSFWTLTPIPDTSPAAPPRRAPSIDGIAPPDAYDPPGTINEFDPGGGPYRPDYGDRVWANPMHMAPAFAEQAKPEEPHLSWKAILGAWDAVCIDFQQLGIDLSSGVLDERPWHWFATRLAAITGNPQSWTRRTIDLRKADTSGDSPR